MTTTQMPQPDLTAIVEATLAAAKEEGLDLGPPSMFAAIVRAEIDLAPTVVALAEVERSFGDRFMAFVELAEHRRALLDDMNGACGRDLVAYDVAHRLLRADAIEAGVIDENGPDLMDLALAATRGASGRDMPCRISTKSSSSQ